MESRDSRRSWWAGWHSVDQEEPIGEHLIEVRIDRLQRELRVYRVLFALVALIFAGLGAMWLNQTDASSSDVVRAKRVEVLSPDGRAAVVLDSDRVGGRIALRYNQQGAPPPPAMFLTAAPTGGAIQLFEPGQNFYALAFDIGEDGEGILKVRARGMREGLELSGPKDGQTGGKLTLYNAEGNPAVKLTTDGKGHGVVSANGDKP